MLSNTPFIKHIGSFVAILLMPVFVWLALQQHATIPQPYAFLNQDFNLLVAVSLVITSGICSCLICWLVLWSSHLHEHLTHDHVNSGPQKMHTEPTPRIGGLALAIGLGVSILLLNFVQSRFQADFPFNVDLYSLVLLSATPAFLGGIVEDLTKRVGPLDRLMLTMASGAFAAYLFGGILTRLDMPWLDGILVATPLLAILFTAFAVAGVANSINIMDGFNGLSSGYSIIVLLGLAAVAFFAQDNLVLQLSCALLGALVGFFLWNWPNGNLFLGDGGAYLMGFLLAELSILLVIRNPEVSAWFPLVLMAYPITETLYSVYRRKYVHDTAPGQPDRHHLHHLIYDKIVILPNPKLQLPESGTVANAKVAKYLWIPVFLITGLAVQYWDRTLILSALLLLTVVSYILSYKKLAST